MLLIILIMFKNSFLAVLLGMSCMLFFSCNKEKEFSSSVEFNQPNTLTTKAAVDDSPIVTVYVETNDVNPLNAGDYEMPDGSTLFDIVELFAANIRDTTINSVNEPTLFLNNHLAPLLQNGANATYVAPLQAKGQAVLLTVLGDHTGMGVGNLSATQQYQFANILAWAVIKYGLDGIGFDDEYADYSGSLVSNSYGNIISYLKALLPWCIVTVFDIGNTSQISSSVGAQIDYSYFPYFGYYNTYNGISGITADRHAPYCLNLGSSYYYVSYYSGLVKTNGYGAIMCFNLRTVSDKNPLTTLQNISNGIYNGAVITCTDGDKPQTQGTVYGGYHITNSEAKAGLIAAGYTPYNY